MTDNNIERGSHFIREIVEQSDYGIDLHTGSNHRTNLPQIRANLDDAKTKAMAEAFGVTSPPLFGIIGGPPCKDFSVGGRNGGGHGEQGRLSKMFVDKICQLNFKFLMFLTQYIFGFILSFCLHKYYFSIYFA